MHRIWAVLALIILTACTPIPRTHTTVHVVGIERTIRFTAAGDSITAWVNPSPNPITWITYVQDATTRFEGGWAQPGAQLAHIASETPRIVSDVQIIMAGTNDIRADHNIPTMLEQVQRIADLGGAHHVLASAIAPSDDYPAQTNEYNAALHEYAAEQGWGWVDPWAAIRDVTGRYLPGTTLEGIHPTETGEQAAARIIAAALHR